MTDAADRRPLAAKSGEATIKTLLSYRLHRTSSAISRSAALRYRRQFDVSLGEWRALALLGGGAASSLNELARAADLDKAQMSRVISGLSDRGLVERKQRAVRGRTVDLVLSRPGQALYRRLIGAAAERDAAFVACLTQEELKALESALGKLSALARAMIGAEGGPNLTPTSSVDNDNTAL